MLGWRLEMHDDGDAHLRDDDGRIQVWLNVVPEPKTVKNRVHLDVNAESVDAALDAGATVVAGVPSAGRRSLDPDGPGALRLRPRAEPIEKRAYELVWDCAEGAEASHDIAAWWARGRGRRGRATTSAASPGSRTSRSCPWDSFDFGGVPEPKTAKNRVHIDVSTDDLDALVAHGATVLRAKGDGGLGWTVLADPDGNEFCAFTD